MQTGEVPAIKNLDKIEGRLNYAKLKTKFAEPINTVVKNGQTLKGSNYSIVFKRYTEPTQENESKMKSML